jgi:hypothetical protein
MARKPVLCCQCTWPRAISLSPLYPHLCLPCAHPRKHVINDWLSEKRSLPAPQRKQHTIKTDMMNPSQSAARGVQGPSEPTSLLAPAPRSREGNAAPAHGLAGPSLATKPCRPAVLSAQAPVVSSSRCSCQPVRCAASSYLLLQCLPPATLQAPKAGLLGEEGRVEVVAMGQ